jgi:hypothetical protein
MPSRSRLYYAGSAVLIIALGLFWRSRFCPLGPFLVKYGGDALWAALVYVLIRFCRPSMNTLKCAALGAGIAIAVELSQLYHEPWLDTIRAYRLGALVLGSTFNWPDIPAYVIGIAIATLADRLLQGGGTQHSRYGGR